MHIEFKKLVLHNFMSFGHSELTFEDDGFIRVSGMNKSPDDLATSNGSGKSSIWEGLVWAMTGETIRGTKQIANMYGQDGTFVQLVFNIDNINYDIIRSKDHKEYKTNIRILIDGKDCSGKGVRESASLLAQYLPDITSSLLGSVIVLGQGLPQKFTNNTPSGRKEVLEKLSKSDFMIEDLKDRVAKRKKEITDKIRTIENDIVSLNGKRALLDSQIVEAEKSISEMEKTKLEQELVEVKERCATISKEVTSFESTIAQLNNEILNLQEFISSIEKQRFGEETLIREAHLAKYGELNEQCISLNAELKQINKALFDAEHIKDVCPTCGQKISGVVKPDTSHYKKKIEEITNLLQETKSKWEWSQKQRDLEIQECKNKYSDALKEKQDDIKWKQQVLSNNTTMLKQARSSLMSYQESLSRVTNEIAQFDATMKSLTATVDNNKQGIKDIDASLVDKHGDLEAIQARCEVINKFETSLKRDFRGYLLSNIIAYISNRTKEYCKMIFDTDKIDFCLDGNNIEISYLGKQYENLSGGEKQKIDLIIQFSIRDMLCGYLGFTSNVLVLDEVFDGLDMIGCQRVLDVISSISDIKNIFIVTHRKDLSIPTDKELVVIKSECGISEIKV